MQYYCYGLSAFPKFIFFNFNPELIVLESKALGRQLDQKGGEHPKKRPERAACPFHHVSLWQKDGHLGSKNLH